MTPEDSRIEGAEKGTAREKKKLGWKGRILVGIGIFLVVAGGLVFLGIHLYVNYTDSFARNAQKELFRDWEKSPAAPKSEKIPVGAGFARLIIPRLDLDVIVVELSGLADRESLKRGPGHVPETAYPGEPGNMVIAGHRTTYAAPFKHMDLMGPGDKIIVETKDGRYVYEFSEQKIVPSNDLAVLEQEGEPRVSLIACHPLRSARQRIVVVGRLIEAK